MSSLLSRINRIIAVAQAKRGVALVTRAINDTRLPRLTRRSVARSLAHGTVSVEAVFGEDER